MIIKKSGIFLIASMLLLSTATFSHPSTEVAKDIKTGKRNHSGMIDACQSEKHHDPFSWFRQWFFTKIQFPELKCNRV